MNAQREQQIFTKFDWFNNTGEGTDKQHYAFEYAYEDHLLDLENRPGELTEKDHDWIGRTWATLLEIEYDEWVDFSHTESFRRYQARMDGLLESGHGENIDNPSYQPYE